MALFLNIVGHLLEIAWVVSFLFGVYCALLAWQNRVPQRTRHHKGFPTMEDFKPAGRAWLKKGLQAWGVALGTLVLATLVF